MRFTLNYSYTTMRFMPFSKTHETHNGVFFVAQNVFYVCFYAFTDLEKKHILHNNKKHHYVFR